MTPPRKQPKPAGNGTPTASPIQQRPQTRAVTRLALGLATPPTRTQRELQQAEQQRARAQRLQQARLRRQQQRAATPPPLPNLASSASSSDDDDLPQRRGAQVARKRARATIVSSSEEDEEVARGGEAADGGSDADDDEVLSDSTIAAYAAAPDAAAAHGVPGAGGMRPRAASLAPSVDAAATTATTREEALRRIGALGDEQMKLSYEEKEKEFVRNLRVVVEHTLGRPDDTFEVVDDCLHSTSLDAYGCSVEDAAILRTIPRKAARNVELKREDGKVDVFLQMGSVEAAAALVVRGPPSKGGGFIRLHYPPIAELEAAEALLADQRTPPFFQFAIKNFCPAAPNLGLIEAVKVLGGSWAQTGRATARATFKNPARARLTARLLNSFVLGGRATLIAIE